MHTLTIFSGKTGLSAAKWTGTFKAGRFNTTGLEPCAVVPCICVGPASMAQPDAEQCPLLPELATCSTAAPGRARPGRCLVGQQQCKCLAASAPLAAVQRTAWRQQSAAPASRQGVHSRRSLPAAAASTAHLQTKHHMRHCVTQERWC